MKHFFDESNVLDEAAMTELLNKARQELKQKPMILAEMSSKMDLICFNASASDQYVPRGMDTLITTKNVALSQKIAKDFSKTLETLISNTPGDVFGYLLGNIQTKNIYNYLDIIFDLKHNFRFRPQLVVHFSFNELIEYLSEFLNASIVDGIKRKIEVFDDKKPTSWKSLTKSSELKSVDKEIREPIVLDRPFFSDIYLKIIKSGQNKIVDSSFGKLNTVIGYFNRYRSPAGELIRSKNKLFLKWKDIDGFKLSSSQSKSLLGISYKGEYIASAQFVSHDIGLKKIILDDIDFFTFKINKKATDIKPKEIINIEVNIDTQQLVLKRGILEDEFHIARFNRLKLYKDNQTAYVHKIIPFNRGASNFDQIQTYFGTRYTEYEKAGQILTARGELGLLSSRNVTTSDLTSHLLLSSMNLLGILPFEANCVGFSPKDIKNPSTTSQLFNVWFKELQDLFNKILDISGSPDFTEHNFTRLSKNMRFIIKCKKVSEVEPDTYELLIKELEELTQYMDDFFKLNVYKSLNDELECETVPDFDEQGELEDFALDNDKTRLDDKTKQFISEHYSFFQKRDLIQKALLRIEKVMFYNNNIKPYAENKNFEPDLVVYSNTDSQMKNYQYASYPALSLSTVLEPGLLSSRDEIDELMFVKFMRDFTQRTFHKARELNKTFHHQYKHTLSELSFIVDEKLRQLQDELDFLETPEHKEDAYKQLLAKITSMFHDHLKSKEKNIANLKKEQQEIKNKLEHHKKLLEKLLDIKIEDEKLESMLQNMPDRLDQIKDDILSSHKNKLNETAPVFNSYVRLHTYASRYFHKVLNYAKLFEKALWMHRRQQMFEEVMTSFEPLFTMEPDLLKEKISEMELLEIDNSREKKVQKEINVLTQELKDSLAELEKIPSKGLFQSPITDRDRLIEYLDYYKEETFRLTHLVNNLRTAYQQLNKIQNDLFKKQEELTASKVKQAEIDLKIQIAKLILKNPNNREEIDALKDQTENIPREIKDELGTLRAKLIEALTNFKSIVTKENLESIVDYKELTTQSTRREKINNISKELVNFRQGIKAIQKEIEGEYNDLEYLKTQENGLEKVAMSKALPSTRVLLKTQYIPMVKREKEMLNRANRFLAEIISKEKRITEALTSTFFRKRHGFYQFSNGKYCLDTSAGTKHHTEKNIYAAYLQLAERHKKAFDQAQMKIEKTSILKLETPGIDSIRNRISQIWHDHAEDRFLFLPPSLSVSDALELCGYKDMICKNNPKESRSVNSLVLIYVHAFKYEEIQSNKELLNQYNQAILSNIFINIDGVKVFNNKESIYEACIKNTFGNCNDKIGFNVSRLLVQS